jgi:hypothetical protein
VITFSRLKYLSFFLSAVYLGLLIMWLGHGPEDVKYVFGWVHGIGWIVSSTLCIIAARLRVIPLWLAVMVALHLPERPPERGMVLGQRWRSTPRSK